VASAAAAEARGKRLGVIEKEVAEAHLKAQQASLDQDKEVGSRKGTKHIRCLNKKFWRVQLRGSWQRRHVIAAHRPSLS
jgi:ribosomal protein L19E